MNRAEALGALERGNQRERLEAARALSKTARSSDVTALKRALRSERVPWIRTAIESGIARATVSVRDELVSDLAPLTSEDALAQEVYARATEELTDRFVHEFRPLLGLARVYVQQEIPNHEESKTAAVLRQMQDVLRAIDTLGRAAAIPKVTESNLGSLVSDTVEACRAEFHSGPEFETPVAFDGPEFETVMTDPDLLVLALRNGIKNALEASVAATEPVVVSWGQSSESYWISVIDYGTGLKDDLSVVFAIGTTTKSDHLGMGLAIAQRAMTTLGGSIALESTGDGGTKFELIGPRLDQ